ncbi:hypothetical protein Ancab_031887 [Ancistrocladus abbreviatus]
MPTMQLEVHMVPTVEGDKDQCIVADADGSAITTEGELGDGIKVGEERRDVREKFTLGVEREALMALSPHLHPTFADGRAFFTIADVEGREDLGQALIW